MGMEGDSEYFGATARDEHEANELHMQLASSDDPLTRLASPRHELSKEQLTSLVTRRGVATRESTR
jgi:hypothetical protein